MCCRRPARDSAPVFLIDAIAGRINARCVVAACIHSGTQYRVIAIKERSVDVMYRDELQVAVRPKAPKE